MNEDEIKNLRHSFTNPYKEDLPKLKKNQFGHTVLSDNDKELDISKLNVKIDESGQIRADMDTNLLSNENISEWAKLAVNLANFEEDHDVTVNTSDGMLSSLLAELDEMEDVVSNKKILKNNKTTLKDCVNKSCLYALPKDANFCLKCGTAQLAKFCSECGFNFKSEEKFCPDCGTKR